MDGNDAHFYPLIQTHHFRTDSVLWCGLLEQLFRTIDFLSNEKLQPIQLYLRSILITSEVHASGMGLDAVLMNEQMKYAVIVIACFPIMILYPFIQKYFEKGVLIGAVK